MLIYTLLLFIQFFNKYFNGCLVFKKYFIKLKPCNMNDIKEPQKIYAKKYISHSGIKKVKAKVQHQKEKNIKKQ